MSTAGAYMVVSGQMDAKCPGCHVKENKKEVCGHCGYEYEKYNEDWTAAERIYVPIIATLLIVFVLWVTFTLFTWLFGSMNWSLLQVLESQWRWLNKLRIL